MGFLEHAGVLLRPGLGLKRWLLVMALGGVLVALGMAFVIAVPVSPKAVPMLRMVTLGGLLPTVRGIIFFVLGGGLVAIGALRVYKLIVLGASQSRNQGNALVALRRYRDRGQGPRIVAIGGGTGLSTLLRGLKHITDNLTAIVTVADDGGSSGRLRTELRIPPPGDARSCMVALSKDESLMERLFDYRFNGDTPLNGHSMGNLLLAALCDIQGGFQEALESASDILSLSGRVVPVSNENNLVLTAVTVNGKRLEGESAVGHANERLSRVSISPEDANISEAAAQAIAFADLIVIGPGSLYTSIAPNFLVRGMRQALAISPAQIAFVCNVATQRHETDGYGVMEHLEVFYEHAGVPVTHLIVNNNVEILPKEWGQTCITPASGLQEFKGTVIAADLVDEEWRTRHDANKLATTLMHIVRRR